jgi:hypothetical protein
MNRRTFLKTVGAVALAISAPITLAKEKPIALTIIDSQYDFMPRQPQWIRFTEEMPKVGQKIIITSHVSILGSISGGVVVENTKGEKFSPPYATLCTVDDFYVNHSSDHSFALFYTEKGRDVISTRDWTKSEEDSYMYPKDFTNERKRVHSGVYYKEHYFWLAVDGEYPKTIPPLPRNPVYDYLENKSSDGVLPGGRSRWFTYLYGKNNE